MNDSISRILWAMTEMEAAMLHLQATLDTERVKLRAVIDAEREQEQ